VIIGVVGYFLVFEGIDESVRMSSDVNELVVHCGQIREEK